MPPTFQESFQVPQTSKLSKTSSSTLAFQPSKNQPATSDFQPSKNQFNRLRHLTLQKPASYLRLQEPVSYLRLPIIQEPIQSSQTSSFPRTSELYQASNPTRTSAVTTSSRLYKNQCSFQPSKSQSHCPNDMHPHTILLYPWTTCHATFSISYDSDISTGTYCYR